MNFVETERRGGAVWLWLNRPDRHNSLIPELVLDLRAAIAAAAEMDPAALVLSGRGASFSTGGDVTGFLAHAGSRTDLSNYAEVLVSALHGAILDLLAFPFPVLAAVNGPVTGGALGLVLAADLVAMAEHSFLQPYYSELGFGPDGGWTALLPDRIGVSKALEIQYLNRRLGAAEAEALGLATRVCPASGLRGTVDGWVSEIHGGSTETHRVTRENVWDEWRREAVRARLNQERTRFLNLITRPATVAGMKEFKRQQA